MVQRGGGTRLLLEPREAVAVVRDGFRENLERDLASQPRVLRPIDLPHPSRAERGEHLVRPEPGAGRNGHGVAGRILCAPDRP
jgi:hypothetical protein